MVKYGLSVIYMNDKYQVQWDLDKEPEIVDSLEDVINILRPLCAKVDFCYHGHDLMPKPFYWGLPENEKRKIQLVTGELGKAPRPVMKNPAAEKRRLKRTYKIRD